MHNNLVFIFLCKTSCGFGDSGWIISVDFVVVSIGTCLGILESGFSHTLWFLMLRLI